MLYSPYYFEVPEQCVASVLQIRDFLTTVIGDGGIAAELREPLRLMRRFCVQFLVRVGATEDLRDADAASRHLFRDPSWRMHDYWFSEALGELRAGVGLQVAIIAASFGLDVEDQLAGVLPGPESDVGLAPGFRSIQGSHHARSRRAILGFLMRNRQKM